MLQSVTPLLLAVLLVYSPPILAADTVPIVVFEIELVDGSMEGRHPDHDARIELTTETLRNLFARDGRFRLMDPAPVAEAVDKLGPLHGCNGCEVDMARQLGARYAVLSRVQKVSSLILGMEITVVDARTGHTVQLQKVSIRGDTDESWIRGVRYMFRHNLDLGALTTESGSGETQKVVDFPSS